MLLLECYSYIRCSCRYKFAHAFCEQQAVQSTPDCNMTHRAGPADHTQLVCWYACAISKLLLLQRVSLHHSICWWFAGQLSVRPVLSLHNSRFSNRDQMSSCAKGDGLLIHPAVQLVHGCPGLCDRDAVAAARQLAYAVCSPICRSFCALPLRCGRKQQWSAALPTA